MSVKAQSTPKFGTFC